MPLADSQTLRVADCSGGDLASPPRSPGGRPLRHCQWQRHSADSGLRVQPTADSPDSESAPGWPLAPAARKLKKANLSSCGLLTTATAKCRASCLSGCCDCSICCCCRCFFRVVAWCKAVAWRRQPPAAGIYSKRQCRPTFQRRPSPQRAPCALTGRLGLCRALPLFLLYPALL